MQYLWWFGEAGDLYSEHCADPSHVEELKCVVVEAAGYKVSGWIATVKVSGQLGAEDDNINKLVVLFQGKTAQEDILEEFAEGGIYTKYLFGEIHAEFLDDDEKPDIATSSRQAINKDDERYLALKEWVKTQLKHIQSKWTTLRNQKGAEEAFVIPGIREWFDHLSSSGSKKSARSLFGKINQLTLDSSDKKLLFKHSVLAFESLKIKENLDALERMDATDLPVLKELFTSLDDVEAALYHEIITERLAKIKTLKDKALGDDLEKAVQEHIFNNLWLLDTSWDRATENPVMEEEIGKAIGKLNGKLERSAEGKLALGSRLDIRYKNPAGRHVIVELKRGSVLVDSNDLGKQVSKYIRSIRAILRTAGRGNEPVEAICILGRKCSDFVSDEDEDEALRALRERSIRIMYYQELIDHAYEDYRSFLDKKAEAGRITEFLRQIETADVS